MYRVISFSLYGSHRIYGEGALRNLELAPVFYPGWICRFYLDDSVPLQYQEELTARGAEIVRVTKKSLGPMYGRYWRMWVAADAAVDRYIVRDVDSRLNARERAGVDEWIASGKTFHIMRDSACHRTRALAGMWGGVGGKLPDVADLIDGWGKYDEWGQTDQFTSDILLPLMGEDYLCHDGAGYFDDGKSFPPHAPLVGTRYVGERIEVDRPPVDIWRQSAEFENRLIQEQDRTTRLEQECSTIRREADERQAQWAAERCAALEERDRIWAEKTAREAEIAFLRQSWSWRLTSPLRGLRSVVARPG
jgi:hypothetical protein